MLQRINKHLRKFEFDLAVRSIQRCPPIQCDVSQRFILVSQLRSTDAMMYLLALGSFTQYLTPRRIVVLDDGSLRLADHTLLKRQIPTIEVRPISSIDTGSCPRGGTWERLLFILDLSEQDYVIQLDADTLSMHDLTEVRQCIIDNRSFTLGTPTGREFVSLEEASRFAMSNLPHSQHVQILAERVLANSLRKENLRYVRGNSGFAGFARGASSRSLVEEFSRAMEGLLGMEKWREWGSEQVSSNFAVANSPSALILPQPRYAFFSPNLNYAEAAFIHFIGTHRYRNGVYTHLAREVIAHLQTAPR